MSKTKIPIAFVFIASFLLFTSCTEEEPKIIPDVYVSFSINLSLPQYNALNSVNNSIIVPNEGYDNNGVIVYRYTLEEFLAFDATCPQHIHESTAIILDDGGAAGTATCPHCETSYSFYNFGQASSGYPLKRYNATVSGSFVNVSN